MRINELRVVFYGNEIEKIKKEVSDIFYSYGATGLKIEEPLEEGNELDYYKNIEIFRNVDYSVSAYFPENLFAKKRNDMIKESIDNYFKENDESIYTFEVFSYQKEDYENAWKNYLYPEKISEKFVVKPTWRDYEKEEGELVIELDPGRAFGTGSHSTTSLCIKLMEENIEKLKNVKKTDITLLDVGTGSGILMIAASKLGVKKVVGTDIDELAVEVAKENLELNKIPEDQYEVYKGDLIATLKDRKFNIVVANILSDVLLVLMKDISKVVEEDGIIILSGIIEEKLNEVIKEVERLGYKLIEERKDKEWVAILIKKIAKTEEKCYE